jgi:hypothetical protein
MKIRPMTELNGTHDFWDPGSLKGVVPFQDDGVNSFEF